MLQRYEPYVFSVSLGWASPPLAVRVYGRDRDDAWARVRQMHPRAVETRALGGAEREKSHNQTADPQKSLK